MKKLLLLIVVLAMPACSTLSQDENTRMVRIIQTVGDAEARAGTFTQRAKIEGDVQGLRVETSDKPIEGSLKVKWVTPNSTVEYVR